MRKLVPKEIKWFFQKYLLGLMPTSFRLADCFLSSLFLCHILWASFTAMLRTFLSAFTQLGKSSWSPGTIWWLLLYHYSFVQFFSLINAIWIEQKELLALVSFVWISCIISFLLALDEGDIALLKTYVSPFNVYKI